jgi:hypothetical protein
MPYARPYPKHGTWTISLSLRYTSVGARAQGLKAQNVGQQAGVLSPAGCVISSKLLNISVP